MYLLMKFFHVNFEYPKRMLFGDLTLLAILKERLTLLLLVCEQTLKLVLTLKGFLK